MIKGDTVDMELENTSRKVFEKFLFYSEKPETLEELDVVQEDLIEVTEITEAQGRFIIKIGFVPTVPHCSLATLIGLCIRSLYIQ